MLEGIASTCAAGVGICHVELPADSRGITPALLQRRWRLQVR